MELDELLGEASMERKTLLSVLSPQLQTLVEASLGEKLQIRQTPTVPATGGASGASKVEDSAKSSHANSESSSQAKATLDEPTTIVTAARSIPASTPTRSAKLNPSELFVLGHPQSPGFVVKDNFLGHEDALSARNALVALAKTAEFHQAAVGHGDNKREETAVRGDSIHWIRRPTDLKNSTELDTSILLLLRKIESLVFSIKNGIPALDLRNVTSTQLAIFPGDGARFVKHTDTYATAHVKGRSDAGSGGAQLIRLVTCVYYLNLDWVPDHGGCLRVFTKDSPQQHWDAAPVLDTLVVFRSTDVEHEVLPTFHERMALTVWYYGPPPPVATKPQAPAAAALASLPSLAPFLAPATLSADTIFVAIPSYRDSECRHTVDDLIQKARNPSRISIGICLQCDHDDDTQTYLESKYPSSQVRITHVDYRDAAGPCVARAIAQALYEHETYYLQIDSHMRFRDGWDDFLIEELTKCPSPKAILTTYPFGYTLPNQLSEDERPALLCASNFDDQSMLRQSSKTLARKAHAPIPSLFWAAGFAFSSGRVVRDVPYDASLRFLFFGEEASMSARLWTHGWDFYAPSEMVIYHLWTRAYRPVFQELESDDTKMQRQRSLGVVRAQLRDGHGLGIERGVVEYQRHIGVDFSTQTVEWRAEWGNLDPIQFDLTVTKENI